MKIVLLGYMTSGKSSIGKQLSKNLSMKFLDLDDYIVEKEKMPITEIFSSKGEIYFRLIENTYLKEVLAKEEDFILSLGGGTPCYANNMEAINKGKTKSVYLKATNQTLIDRLILKKSTRPIIANLSDDQIPEFVAKHLFERRFYYEQAKYTLNVDDKTIKKVSEEIEMLLY
ncbi:shikimate kinase [uncultured Polaribacter sp.]|uniref:shikimate kinase n=1 Tax=uncultured Polaribacter sp. TaxID=174711 RepID=UPI0026218E9A|nr:shikimate kinase [uncultured Polaribacter sp.]